MKSKSSNYFSEIRIRKYCSTTMLFEFNKGIFVRESLNKFLMKKTNHFYWLLECTALFIMMAGLASGCSEKERVEVSQIALSEKEINIVRDGTYQLAVSVVPEDALDYVEVAWESADSGVASVSEDGVVSGIAVGSTTVSASVDGVVAVCRVNVVAKPADEVLVEPSELSVVKGETYELKATVLPEDADDKRIVWSTEDSTVAAVSSEGVLSAVGVGTVKIYAACGDAVGECTVTVEGISVESVSVSPSLADVVVGEQIKLVASVMPDNADYESIEWSTSDETVATVDEKGLVTGLQAGKAVITASIGDIYGSAEIEVVMPQASVGDFYYSDGTWSTELDPDKNVLGIVFYVGQNPNDFSDYSETGIGKPRCNGYVMALVNASEEYCYWGPESGIDLHCYPVNEDGSVVDNYSGFKDCDWSGYKYTQIIKDAAEANGGPSPESAAHYPVIYYTLKYEEAYPSPANSSGWFLPAISQTWAIVENRDLLAKAGADLPVDWYYSSSEDSWALDMVLSINMESMTVRSNWKESKVNSIRTILAF